MKAPIEDYVLNPATIDSFEVVDKHCTISFKDGSQLVWKASACVFQNGKRVVPGRPVFPECLLMKGKFPADGKIRCQHCARVTQAEDYVHGYCWSCLSEQDAKKNISDDCFITIGVMEEMKYANHEQRVKQWMQKQPAGFNPLKFDTDECLRQLLAERRKK